MEYDTWWNLLWRKLKLKERGKKWGKILNRMAKKRLIGKATFYGRPGGSEEVSPLTVWGKSMPRMGWRATASAKTLRLASTWHVQGHKGRSCGWKRWVQGCAIGDEIPKEPEQVVTLWVIFSLNGKENHCRALIRRVTPFDLYLVHPHIPNNNWIELNTTS